MKLSMKYCAEDGFGSVIFLTAEELSEKNAIVITNRRNNSVNDVLWDFHRSCDLLWYSFETIFI